MQLELITYGNGETLDHVMTGVANIVSSPDYGLVAMIILALATLLGITGYHKDMASYGMQAHGTWIIKGITSIAIFWMLIGGSINVFIYDPLNNYNGVVDHVPLGIAMPVYFENQISENLSTLYSEWMAPSGYPSEFAYDNPSNAAGFYNPGMVSPLHAINVLTQAHFTDQYFYESLSDFTQNCIIPAMMLGVIDPNQFYIAGPGQAYPDDSIQDLLAVDMANMPTGWTSTIYTSGNPGGTTDTCANNWNSNAGLNAQINTMTAPNGSLAGQYGGYLNTATGSNQTALADQALLGNAAGYMLGFSTTGQQILGQAALMNSLSGPIAQFAQSTGTSSQAQAYALTEAFNQSQNSWTTSAIMAAKMLPIFHLIMEMIVIAVFPLFFVLAVVPTMTTKYLKLLFELLMWLALWSPIASIINFLVQQFMETKIFNNVSSTAMSGIQGFNYANYTFIAGNSITYTAVTGAIMWIVPVLSFGLVTGSAFVMSGAIGAVSNMAHGSAASQGAGVGTSSGLQGIEGQGSSWERIQALNNNAKNTGGAVSADEKIAGMGALDNTMNAQSFEHNMQALGYQKMLAAKTNNQAATYGGGDAYKSMEQAYQTGAGKTEQGVGSIEGAQKYADKAFNGSLRKQSAYGSEVGAFSTTNQGKGIEKALGGSLTSAAVNTKMTDMNAYNATNSLTKQEAMQGIANKYFGGDLNKEMSYINTINSQKELGGAVGIDEGYQIAKANGFKGSRQNYIDSNATLQNVGAYASARVTKGEMDSVGLGGMIKGGISNGVQSLNKGLVTSKDAALLGQMEGYTLMGKLEGMGYNPPEAESLAYKGIMEQRGNYDNISGGTAYAAGFKKSIGIAGGGGLNEYMANKKTPQTVMSADVRNMLTKGINSKNPTIKNEALQAVLDSGEKTWTAKYDSKNDFITTLSAAVDAKYGDKAEAGFKIMGTGDNVFAVFDIKGEGKVAYNISELTTKGKNLLTQHYWNNVQSNAPTSVAQAKGAFLEASNSTQTGITGAVQSMVNDVNTAKKLYSKVISGLGKNQTTTESKNNSLNTPGGGL